MSFRDDGVVLELYKGNIKIPDRIRQIPIILPRGKDSCRKILDKTVIAIKLPEINTGKKTFNGIS